MCPSPRILSLNNLIRRLLVAALWPVILTGTAGAGDFPPVPLEVWVRTELPNVQPPFRRVFVTSGTNKFAFLIPDGLQINNDTAHGKLRFMSIEKNRMISFSILDPAPAGDQELNPETYRNLALSRHPNGKITEEVSCGAAGKSGPGFDIRWTGEAGIAQCTRFGFVPTDAGVLEFEATTSPDKFRELLSGLNTLMGTLNLSTNGKLEVPPISDKL